MSFTKMYLEEAQDEWAKKKGYDNYDDIVTKCYNEDYERAFDVFMMERLSNE
jgi:hypothetical protein